MTRKYKRSIIYTKLFKTYEEELTYERFVKELYSRNYECEFRYKNLYIDVAYHLCNKNIVYELNISDASSTILLLEFNSIEELLNTRAVEGKTIKELWEFLEN